MALDCKREAFKPGPGCPEISVNLNFPDFASCKDAEPGRLKSVAKMDLQRSPAFPVFIPGNDPLPVYIPDIENILDDIPCALDSYDAESTTISINGKESPNSRVDMVVGPDCQLAGFDIDINFDMPKTPRIVYSDGAVLYRFYADYSNDITL